MTVSYKDIFENEYEEKIKLVVIDSIREIHESNKIIPLDESFNPKEGVDIDGR